MIQKDKLHGEKMMGFESPDCTEIDTLDDLDYVRYQIEKKGSEIYDYLKQNF